MRVQSTAQIVNNLIGEVKPVGETHTDIDRYSNLVELTELVDRLIERIKDTATHRGSYEASVNKIGSFAQNYLDTLRTEI